MKTVSIIQWLGLSALLALTACTKEPGEAAPDTDEPKVDTSAGTVTFVTNSPQLGAIVLEPVGKETNDAVRMSGRLYWDDDVTVRVFTPIAGRVVAVRVKLGQTVAANEALAEIDSPDFGQALATTRTAAGNLAAAEKALARSKELLQHGAGTQKDLEAAEAAEVAARAERDRANWVLANYGGSASSTNAVYLLRTPLAGVVVERNISPGQELRGDLMLANAPNLSAPNFVISDPTRLWVQLDAAESDAAAFQPGQPLRIFSRALPGRVFSGELDTAGNSLDATSRTLNAHGVVNNPDKLLKAEMYVTVEMAGARASALTVSSQAVFLQGEDHFVFVQEQPGRFRKHPITPGDESAGRVAILGGLAEGDKVVTDGCIFLQQLLE